MASPAENEKVVRDVDALVGQIQRLLDALDFEEDYVDEANDASAALAALRAQAEAGAHAREALRHARLALNDHLATNDQQSLDDCLAWLTGEPS